MREKRRVRAESGCRKRGNATERKDTRSKEQDFFAAVKSRTPLQGFSFYEKKTAFKNRKTENTSESTKQTETCSPKLSAKELPMLEEERRNCRRQREDHLVKLLKEISSRVRRGKSILSLLVVHAQNISQRERERRREPRGSSFL